jgi:hypothetical protein
MRKLLLVSAAIGGLLIVPAAFADVSVTIGPDVDTWVESYDAPAVTYEGDVVVGTALPEDVQIVEVPKHENLGFVRLGKKRVIVERKTHKIIKVY